MKKKESIDLAKAVAAINDKYGEGAISTGSSHPPVVRVPTGYIGLDYALGGGGMPLKRKLEVVGAFSSGKTLIMTKLIRAFQRFDFANGVPNVIEKIHFDEKKMKITKVDLVKGYKPVKPVEAGIPAVIDAEGSFDKAWAKLHGVDTSALLIMQPSSSAEALNTMEMLTLSDLVSLVCLDSVAVLAPESELDTALGESSALGSAQRLLGQATRKLTAAMNSTNNDKVAYYIINRKYDKISMYGGSSVWGGNALKLFKDIALELTAKESKVKEVVVGKHINIKNTKNKTGSAHREIEMYLDFVGNEHTPKNDFDRVMQTVDLAIAYEVVKRKGSYFTYYDVTEQGKEAFVTAILKKEEAGKTYFEYMEDEVKEAMEA